MKTKYSKYQYCCSVYVSVHMDYGLCLRRYIVEIQYNPGLANHSSFSTALEAFTPTLNLVARTMKSEELRTMVQERMTFLQSSRVQVTNRKMTRKTESCRISQWFNHRTLNQILRDNRGRTETIPATVIITSHDLNIYEIYLVKRKSLFHWFQPNTKSPSKP